MGKRRGDSPLAGQICFGKFGIDLSWPDAGNARAVYLGEVLLQAVPISTPPCN
jgi:hypothetical protein